MKRSESRLQSRPPGVLNGALARLQVKSFLRGGVACWLIAGVLLCLGASVGLASTSEAQTPPKNSAEDSNIGQPSVQPSVQPSLSSGPSNTSPVPTTFFHALAMVGTKEREVQLKNFCQKVNVRYVTLGWGQSPCLALPWRFERLSERGDPLIYLEFDSRSKEEREHPSLDETTLILGGVHPDELTPIHLAFRFAETLQKEAQIYGGRRVVIAPLVNPDGFFDKPARRTNANGIDLNRNFPTRDWWANAQKYWKARRKSDPRHFPGQSPMTEEGTQFQIELLEEFEPDKIISVHAPLGFLDYDGPGDTKKKKHLSDNEKRARELANVISRSSNNYQIRDFTFYPGSLGNYSGNERSVPTLTLELRSSDPRLAQKFWKEFSPGLRSAIKYEFRKNSLAKLEEKEEKPTK